MVKTQFINENYCNDVCFSSSFPHRAETADLKILIADLSLLTELLSEENLSITLSDLARKLLALQSSRY